MPLALVTTVLSAHSALNCSFFDGLDGTAIEHLVFQQHQMRGQNIRVLAQVFGCLLDDFAQFVLGVLDGQLEAVYFVLQILLVNKIFLDNIDTFPVNQIGLADANAGRSADPF